jgi:hypothetical protein
MLTDQAHRMALNEGQPPRKPGLFALRRRV